MSDPIPLTLTQGDDKSWTATMKNPDDSPWILTGATIRGDIKKEYTTEVVASFTITPTDLANGIFDYSISAADSNALPMRAGSRVTSFVFDIEITYIGGEIETPISGYLKVTAGVTSNV